MLLRIKFLCPTYIRFSELKERVEMVVERETFSAETIIKDKQRFQEVTLKGNMDKLKDPATFLDTLKAALLTAALTNRIPILINPLLSSSFVSNYLKKVSPIPLESDSIGLGLFENDTKFLSLNANISINLKFEDLISETSKRFATKPTLNSSQLRSLELYNSAKFMTRLNMSASFVLMVSAIECIIEPIDHEEQTIILIQSYIDDAKKSSIDKSDLFSILGQLENMKMRSIVQCGILLINKIHASNESLYNGMSPSLFFKRAYDLRSRIVHDGITSTKHLDVYDSQIEQFVYDTLIRTIAD